MTKSKSEMVTTDALYPSTDIVPGEVVEMNFLYSISGYVSIQCGSWFIIPTIR